MNTRTKSFMATLAAVTLLGGLASAQFTTVGPFAGAAGTEGFETQVQSGFPTCIEDRVFGNQADLCTISEGGTHLTTGWSFSCTIWSHGGARFFGSATTAAEYIFDGHCTKFGGYFGTNYDLSGPGTIEFYDDADILLHSDTISYAFDCTWTWNGWDTGGAMVKKIRVIGDPFGGYVMMDDMEADLTGGGEVGTAYCFCDPGNPGGNVAPCNNYNDDSDPKGAGCRHDDSAAGARLYAGGVASVGNDTLTLYGIRGPVGNSSLFFEANNDLDGAGVQLGDGIRCAGGGLIRVQPRPTNANGEANTTIGISAKTGVGAGTTKRYQWWFRDPGGSPCGNESNTSNGLEITWQT